MIRLGVTCNGLMPEKWAEIHDGIRIFNELGNMSRFTINVNNPSCDRLINDLIESRLKIESFNFAWERLDYDCSLPEECWAGVRIISGDVVDLSLNNNFSPVFPPPCYGLVPPQLPFHIDERPTTHIAHAKFDHIFSNQFLDLLQNIASFECVEVLFNNKVLASHRRIIMETHDVVVAERLGHTHCIFCKTPIMSDHGILIGRRLPDDLVCESVQGIGHLGLERVYVASVSAAQYLKRYIKKGYALIPILDVQSEWADRVSHYANRLSSIFTIN